MNTQNNTALAEKWRRFGAKLDERRRRQWAASEVLAYGPGGLTAVQAATGLAFSTIAVGLAELRGVDGGTEQDGEQPQDSARIRRPGAGRKRLAQSDPGLLTELERLISPATRGDPESPLRWTTKSLRALAEALTAAGHKVSFKSVGNLLKSMKFSLQGNAKTLEGSEHEDRDAQFQYINSQVQQQLESGEPAVSVDTKKKEIVGNYKNGGKRLEPQGSPTPVDVHDFMGELGRASPYGVYDVIANQGWVNVGISADTAEFAVASIRRWWYELGIKRYSTAKNLLVTADCGGSNGNRVRLWKLELQKLADETGLAVTVCHLPPGTSKWNRIEHALFSFISLNWRGHPLVDYQTIVQLIANTTTRGGLKVHCALDNGTYEKGRRVSDAELAGINLHRHEFHGEWNYTIRPNTRGGPLRSS